MTEPVHIHEHGPEHDHGHDHSHDHGHDEGHGLEGYHVHGGAPALDIGGDIGAMVALMDRSALGTELHLRSELDPSKDVHTGVWERDQGTKKVAAAVFAELLEGTYQVLDSDGAAMQRVEIEGGKVATIDLRA